MLEINENKVFYKGYEFTLLNCKGLMGYAIAYNNDLVSYGADEITDVLEYVEKDLDKYIKENLE